MDCAIHLFRNPVEFSDKDQASVVIILATEDQENHLKILRDIMTVFERDETVDELLEKTSPLGILETIERILDDKRRESIEEV